MKTNLKILIPECLEKLASIFPKDLYIVGGKVRNFLLNIDNEDYDLCSCLTIDELEEVIKNTTFELKFKNKNLSTAKIIADGMAFDYATFRQEAYEEGGQRIPKFINFVESPEKDFLRRDFTVNAIYYNLKKQTYHDFCNGLKDLKNKVIRTLKNPDEVLKDDGIRIFRMVRIACELNFKIDRETFLSASRNISNLMNVAGVKVLEEMMRICNSSYIGVCDKSAHIKGVKYLNSLKPWKFMGLSFDRVKINMIKKDVPKYLGLLIDIVDSEKPASVSYFLHNLLLKLELNKKKKEEIVNTLSGYYDALNRIPNKIYFSKYFDNFQTIHQLLLQKNKTLAGKYAFFYKYIVSHKIVVKISDLKITNKDLQKHFPSLPKKSYNVILNMILSDIFEEKYSNDNQTIISEIEKKLKYY